MTLENTATIELNDGTGEEERVLNPEEIFSEMVRSSLRTSDLAYSIIYLDENYTGDKKSDIIAHNFAELMHQRNFSSATEYFNMLVKEEKEYILSTRQYNYTLNDMEFRREFVLDSTNPERKEFKRGGTYKKHARF